MDTAFDFLESFQSSEILRQENQRGELRWLGAGRCVASRDGLAYSVPLHLTALTR